MKADVLFMNGEVITADAQNRIVESVAIKNNIIIAIGSNIELQKLVHDHTTIIDLQGKSLLPGFIDSHLHLTIHGTNLLGVSCIEPHIQSLDELFQVIQQKCNETPKGKWVRAWGFNETKVKEKRCPTIEELDLISLDHPIVVIRTCNHTSIVNSMALKIAGITEESNDPEGGIIEKDEEGNLTGKLLENAHMNLFQYASYTNDEIRQGLKLASEDFIRFGITSIHDAGGYGDGAENIRIMQQAIAADEVKVRVYALLGSLTNSHLFVEKIVQAGPITGLGNDRFKLGPVKLFLDGSSVGPTMATRETYSHTENDKGILYHRQEEINHYLIEAHKKGFQITSHAQGDQAIEMLLDCIEKALAESPRINHRHRIEHGGIMAPDLLERVKNLGIVVIPNPVFMYINGDLYKKYYGERIHYMYPAKDYQEAGIIAAFASDAPVTTHNPLLGIHAAINRISWNGECVGQSQTVSILEAIKAYTWNGAYASFEEHIKGSIEVGKLADLTILSQSILHTKKENIKDIEIDLTMINGEILYDPRSLSKQYN